MKSCALPDRLERDGRDIAELLGRHPHVLDKAALETLFAKYGCIQYFLQFSHPAKCSFLPIWNWIYRKSPTGCRSTNRFSPLEIDAWIEREQALRYQPRQDRGCPFPASDPFELL